MNAGKPLLRSIQRVKRAKPGFKIDLKRARQQQPGNRLCHFTLLRATGDTWYARERAKVNGHSAGVIRVFGKEREEHRAVGIRTEALCQRGLFVRVDVFTADEAVGRRFVQ